MRSLKSGDPVDGSREQDPVSQLGGPQPQPGREMGFPGSEQDDVGGFGEERTGGQVRDGVAFEAGLMVKSSRDLRAGNPAARARISAPEASLAATSRDRTAARYSSWVQLASRA